MKILLVNKFHFMKGGSERYYFTLADAFKSLGHEVVFFAMKDDKNISCEQEKYFVSNASIKGGIKSKLNMVFHIAYSKEAYRNMKLLCEDEKPDLVILNLVHKQITCSIIDAIKEVNPKTKIFWTMHDLICACPAYTMLDGKGNICEKCLDGNYSHCKKNKCIHGSKLMSYLSTYEAKQIKKYGWYDKVDLFICPSQFYKKKLDEAHFTKSRIVWMRNPLPSDAKYELNDHDDNYILYFGRLSKEKGIKNLIDAMKDINYKLYILGAGPIEDELKNYASNYKNIEFKGFQSGEVLTNYIRNARCIVLPSAWYENGPYSAMEAMALGKPLIVSNLGGLPELVENAVNGYIYKTNEELKYVLNLMINLSKDKYSLMCQNSLEKSKVYFNQEQYINGLIKFYEGNE